MQVLNYINVYGEHNRRGFNQPSYRFFFLSLKAYVNNKDINWILTVGMPEGEMREPVYTSNSIEN